MSKVGGAALLALWFGARLAEAHPQGTVGLTAGVAVGELAPRSAFHAGVRGDVLFGRSRASDFGAGPYAMVATHALDSLDVGGGASLLVPLTHTFPLVLSSGVLARRGDGHPGFVSGGAFFGSRSYNFHSPYGLALGFFAEGRARVDAQGWEALAGIQIDGMVLALPILLAIRALGR